MNSALQGVVVYQYRNLISASVRRLAEYISHVIVNYERIAVVPKDLFSYFKFHLSFLPDKTHNGPGPVGMISPTIPDNIQIIRAITNAFIQPKL